MQVFHVNAERTTFLARSGKKFTDTDSNKSNGFCEHFDLYFILSTSFFLLYYLLSLCDYSHTILLLSFFKLAPCDNRLGRPNLSKKVKINTSIYFLFFFSFEKSRAL